MEEELMADSDQKMQDMYEYILEFRWNKCCLLLSTYIK